MLTSILEIQPSHLCSRQQAKEELESQLPAKLTHPTTCATCYWLVLWLFYLQRKVGNIVFQCGTVPCPGESRFYYLGRSGVWIVDWSLVVCLSNSLFAHSWHSRNTNWIKILNFHKIILYHRIVEKWNTDLWALLLCFCFDEFLHELV